MKEPSFQLRRANKNDEDAAFVLFEEIQLIHSNAKPEIFREPEKDEIFRHFFDGVMNDPDQHLVFACVSGMEIAYIHYFLGVCPESVYKRERLLAHVHALVVANGYRRTGCGSMLLEHVKQAARRFLQQAHILGLFRLRCPAHLTAS